MSEAAVPTSLQIHTLDTLLDEMVSGRPIALNGDGQVFQIVGADARSIFAWYRDHRDRWARSVAKDDIEDIVNQLDRPAPVLTPAAAAAGARGKRILLLKSIRAHRFGGIHRFGTLDEAPDEFTFTFERPLTLVKGANGSGKTSFLSAILWCLTGYVYCPLRPPELADQAIPVTAGAGDEATQRFMSPITPLPPASVLGNLGDNALPLDTWVELEFSDEQGNPAGTLRRKCSAVPTTRSWLRSLTCQRLGLTSRPATSARACPPFSPTSSWGANPTSGQPWPPSSGSSRFRNSQRTLSASRQSSGRTCRRSEMPRFRHSTPNS